MTPRASKETLSVSISASLPKGAQRRTSPSTTGECLGFFILLSNQGSCSAGKFGGTCQDSLKFRQGRPDPDSLLSHLKLPDGSFVRSASVLYDRDSLPDTSLRLKIAQEDHQIGQIGSLKTGLLRIEKPVLGGHQNCYYPSRVEISEQLVKVRNERAIAVHGQEIAA